MRRGRGSDRWVADATGWALALPLAALALGLSAPEGASAQATEGDGASGPEIREWEVPWENTRPRDPYVGPEGRTWFVGQRGDYLAFLDPGSGDFRKYDLEDGTGPHNLIVAEDGSVWYAGNRAAHIGRLDPATGAIEKHAMPDPAVRDPHTMVFDGDGDIWFTVQGGNFVGHLDTASGEVRLAEVSTGGARPYGIKLDSEGRPWIALLGTNKLATVDPRSMELREIALPRKEARPRRLAVTSDDRVWYVDYAMGYLGAYDPDTGKVEEWRAPSEQEARPYGMASDHADRLWFVETGDRPNVLVGFDPAREAFRWSAEIPSGGGTVRHMYFDPETRLLWFGADTNTVGRVRLP